MSLRLALIDDDGGVWFACSDIGQYNLDRFKDVSSLILDIDTCQDRMENPNKDNCEFGEPDLCIDLYQKDI
jgi:hypothetical protein